MPSRPIPRDSAAGSPIMSRAETRRTASATATKPCAAGLKASAPAAVSHDASTYPYGGGSAADGWPCAPGVPGRKGFPMKRLSNRTWIGLMLAVCLVVSAAAAGLVLSLNKGSTAQAAPGPGTAAPAPLPGKTRAQADLAAMQSVLNSGSASRQAALLAPPLKLDRKSTRLNSSHSQIS